MKVRLIIGIFCLLLLGCEEIPPTLGDPIVIIADQPRKVVVEEYTGVRCGNCPAGTSLLQSLKQDFGENLIVVSFHAGFFAQPYPSSQQDFKTEETEALQSLLGEPLGYPAATVNRKLFDGNRILTSSEWAARIQEELNLSSPINIELSADLTSNSESINITVEVEVIQPQSTALFLTAYIVEDNIIDAQATPTEILDNYLHHSILRKILTPINGASIDISEIGDMASLSFDQSLDSNWNIDNLSIVAFVHQNGALLDIVQGEEISLSQ